MDAYSVLQAVLDSGVLPYKLLLACPNSGCTCCSDKVVLERLEKGVKESGVKVWNDLSLVGWVADEEGKLAGIQLQSPGGGYEIPCQAFVYVDMKGVDMQAFKGRGVKFVVYIYLFSLLSFSHLRSPLFSLYHLSPLFLLPSLSLFHFPFSLLPPPPLLLAMNDACLVFDRRLVISTNHATNDPLIYAAGPVTKFSRRYRADQW